MSAAQSSIVLFLSGMVVGMMIQAPKIPASYDRGQADVRLQIARDIATAEAEEDARCTLPSWTPPNVLRWRVDICRAADAHGVAPDLLAILVTVESGGHPGAVSGAGAIGLTQVMPRFWPRILEDPYNPQHQLDVGASIMGKHLDTYGNVNQAAAAYNGGNPSNWDNAQTRAYRKWIVGMWNERNDATSPTLDAWRAAGGSALLAREDA